MIINDMKRNRLKTCKALMALALATALSAASFAQNPGGKVEVKKDYETDLTGAKKGALRIDFSDTLKKFDLNMDYRIQDRQIKDLYSFSPMPSAKVSSALKPEVPSFAAKIGVSFPFAPTLGLWWQPDTGSNSDIVTVKAAHDSYYGTAKLADVDASGKVYALDNDAQAKQVKNTAGVSYTHLWDEHQLDAGIGFRNAYSNYYGVDIARFMEKGVAFDIENYNKKNFMKDNLSHTYNQFEFSLGANSLDSEDYTGTVRYDARFSVTHTSDDAKFGFGPSKFKLQENLIKFNLEAGPTIGKYSMVTAGINSQTAIYKDAQDYHLSLLEGTLSYKLRRNRLSMDLGARISFCFTNKDGGDKYHSYISPKASITYKMDDDKTWAYALADGGNVINSYASLLERAPYLSPMIDLRESGTPLFTKAGIKGKASEEVDYDVYLGGAYRKGMLQFAGNPLDAVYSNHYEGFLGGKLGYKTEGFAAGADAKFSFWTDGERYGGSIPGVDGLSIATPAPEDYAVKGKPAGYAPFEANIYAEANWDEKLFVGATVYARSSTPASAFLYNGQKIKYKGYADVGVYAQYVIDNHFTAYVNGGNLLNARRINWGMYVEKGINVGFGLLIKF